MMIPSKQRTREPFLVSRYERTKKNQTKTCPKVLLPFVYFRLPEVTWWTRPILSLGILMAFSFRMHGLGVWMLGKPRHDYIGLLLAQCLNFDLELNLAMRHKQMHTAREVQSAV